MSIILTNMLYKERIISEADRDTYEYGFQITLANITNFLIVLVIGLVLRSVVKVFTFYCVFISLRIYCGGFHAKSYTRCFLLFGTTCCLCILSSSWIESYRLAVVFFTVGALLLQGLCTYKMAPIEHENRPFTENERKKFRNRSWLVLIVWAAACTAFLLAEKDRIVSIISVTLISVTILMIMAYLRGGETSD